MAVDFPSSAEPPDINECQDLELPEDEDEEEEVVERAGEEVIG